MLIAAKFVAWIGTGSVALLSSLVDSLVDAAASLVTFVAVRQAAMPPDREHRFGHGKAEPLAALGASRLSARQRVVADRRGGAPAGRRRSRSRIPAIGIAVMLFSLVVTIGACRLSAARRAPHRLAGDQRRRAALPRRHSDEFRASSRRC